MIKRLLLSALLLLTYTFASAQPANDSCAHAIALTVGTGICNSVQYDNTGATPEVSDPIPSCWSPASIDNNVWFTFVPDSSRVHISTNFNYSLINTQVAVYSGTCGALSLVACQEDIAPLAGHYFVDMVVTGLTIGNTYYIMVDGNGTGNVGTFGICVENLGPPAPPLLSEDCFTATYLCDTSMITVASNTHGTGSVLDGPYCFPAPPPPAPVPDPGAYWYQFTALTSGNLCFDIYANDGSTDYNWAVYDVSFGCPGFALDCDAQPSLAIATGLGCGSLACHGCLSIGANSTYAILVSRATNNSTGFTLNFTTTTALFGGVPTPTFNHGDSVCVGQSIAFTNTTTTINQNLSFSWNFGDSYTSTSPSPTHAYAAPGVYTVTLIATCGSNSNVTTSTVHILPPLPASVTPSSATICNGDSVTLIGSATFNPSLMVPEDFTNSTPVPISSFTTGAQSDITVSGIGNNFFVNNWVSVCLEITHPNVGDLNIYLKAPDGTQTDLSLSGTFPGGANFTGTCFIPVGGGSLAAGSAPYTGSWAPSGFLSPTFDFTPNDGTWSILIDNFGFSSGTLNSWSITYNIPNYLTYTWTPSLGLSSTTTDTTVATPNVSTTYTFVATDATGCPGSATTQINVTNTPQSTFSINSDTLCIGEVATVTYTGVASAAATYTWTLGGATVVSGTGTPGDPYYLSWAAAGSDTVTLVVQDSSCTSLTTFMYITVNPNPTVTTTGSDTLVCEGTSIDLFANATPSAGATYTWSGPGGFNSTAQNPIIPGATPSMSGPYFVTATSGGCPNNPLAPPVIVTVIPAPVGTAFSNSPVCDEDTIQLSTDTLLGGSYSWSGPNSFTNTTQNPFISPANIATQAGTYTVTITVAGCVTSSSTTVAITALPSPVLATSNSPLCEGSDLFLYTDTLIPGETYSWTGPNGFSDTLPNPMRPGVGPVDSGPYYVTRTINGCTSHQDTLNVTVDKQIFATLPAQEIHTCMLDTVITANDPSPGTGTWSLVSGTGVIQNPGSFSTVVTGVDTGISVYRWMVNNGTCMDSTHLTVIHDGIDTCGTLEVNELITPNNDDLNERLLFTGLMQYPNNKLVIFNRWGNEVFSKNNYQNDWKGRTEADTKGDELPDGTYYYVLTVPGQKPVKGFIEVRK